MKHGKDIRRGAAERVKALRKLGASRRLLTVFIPVTIMAVGVAAASYMIATRPEVAAKPVVERVWTVAAIPAEFKTAQPERRFYGRIVAGRAIDVRPEVSGRVLEIGPNFVEGGVVRKGDPLVRIDAFDHEAKLKEIEADLKGWRGMLERDRERIELLKRDVARRERLVKRGNASEKTLDDSRLSLSEARQQLIDRQTNIERREVDLLRVRRDLADTDMTAPFDGFLVDVTTAVGKFVNVGDTIAKAIAAGRLEARFHVSNQEFRRFLSDGNYRGLKARVVWAGQAFEALLDRIESEVRTGSGGVEVFASIADVTIDTDLRPGAFVEVYVPGPRYEEVVRIPEEALYGGDTVYRVENGRLWPRQVTVAARDGTDLLIRGAFEPGDHLVTTRFPEVGPGLKVQVR